MLIGAPEQQAGALEYFVSWVGYGDDDDCWVSADNTECVSHPPPSQNALDRFLPPCC